MGTKYSSVTVSGYNATPPVDDGTVSEANKVKWSTIKTKLPDPLKTAIESINTSIGTHFDVGPTALTGNTTLGTSHYNQFIQVSGSSVTLTLTDAATLGAGWYCWIVNTDPSNSVTLGRATSGDSINGSAANYTIQTNTAMLVFVVAAANGFRAIANVTTNGANVFTADLTLQSIDATAALGPSFILDRNSASPAGSDSLGAIIWRGRDTAANVQEYAQILPIITDPTSGSEDSKIAFYAYIAGAQTAIAQMGAGILVGSPTGGDKGLGTINATSVYDDNVLLGSAASGSSLVLITSAVASSSASIDFTGITTAYGSYIIKIDRLLPATDGSSLEMQFSTDNGSSWITAAGSYRHCLRYEDSNAAATSRNGDEVTIYLADAKGFSNASTGGIDGEIFFTEPSAATRQAAYWWLRGMSTAAQSYEMLLRGSVRYQTAGTINAIRLVLSTGVIASGAARLYGVRTS